MLLAYHINATCGGRDVGPNGATVFTTAEPTNLPNGVTPVALASTHWQLCGPNEMTYMAYPADIPLEQRLPEVAALDGVASSLILLQLLFWVLHTYSLMGTYVCMTNRHDSVKYHRHYQLVLMGCE